MTSGSKTNNYYLLNQSDAVNLTKTPIFGKSRIADVKLDTKLNTFEINLHVNFRFTGDSLTRLVCIEIVLWASVVSLVKIL